MREFKSAYTEEQRNDRATRTEYSYEQGSFFGVLIPPPFDKYSWISQERQTPDKIYHLYINLDQLGHRGFGRMLAKRGKFVGTFHPTQTTARAMRPDPIYGDDPQELFHRIVAMMAIFHVYTPEEK